MKQFKHVLCVLLCFALLISFAVLPVSAEGTTEACPHVYVHGFMGSLLREDKDDPQSKVIWPPDTDAILADAKEQIPTLVGALLVDNWQKFGDVVIDLVKPYFEPTYLADDGTCPNNSGVYFRYPPTWAIPKNGRVDFDYDWRLNPMEVADDLHEFIEYVREATGAEKVNLSCHSLGGVIVLTYLSKYGHDHVKGVCFNTTAIFGETYTGDLMRGEIVFDADAVDYYLRYALDNNEYEALLTGLISMANTSGLLDLLAKKANGLVKSQKERVIREVLLPMFGNWLTIWSMIPDKDVPDAIENVFNVLCKDEDRSALRTKIDAFNTTVRDPKNETLRTLNEDANVYVISRYGYSSVPVTPSFKVLSDGTVDTRYSSFGATTSDYDKTLPDAAIKDVPPAFVSPNKQVDASTCMFPQQTWLIRNLKHSTTPPSVWQLIDLLLAQDEQATVDSFPEYPRFLKYDETTDTLSADSTETVKSEQLSFMDRFRLFFQQLKQVLEMLFSRLKKN